MHHPTDLMLCNKPLLSSCTLCSLLFLSSPDLFAMETDMIPKFSSKDEEIDFWKTLSLKYKNGCVNWLILSMLFFLLWISFIVLTQTQQQIYSTN